MNVVPNRFSDEESVVAHRNADSSDLKVLGMTTVAEAEG